MPFHQHGTLLKHYGFKQLLKKKAPSPYNPAKMLLCYSEWEHPKLGVLAINHFAHTFCCPLNAGLGDETSLSPTGKNNVLLEAFLKKQLVEESLQSVEMDFTATPIPVDKNAEALHQAKVLDEINEATKKAWADSTAAKAFNSEPLSKSKPFVPEVVKQLNKLMDEKLSDQAKAYWAPEPGQHIVKILPPKAEQGKEPQIQFGKSHIQFGKPDLIAHAGLKTIKAAAALKDGLLEQAEFDAIAEQEVKEHQAQHKTAGVSWGTGKPLTLHEIKDLTLDELFDLTKQKSSAPKKIAKQEPEPLFKVHGLEKSYKHVAYPSIIYEIQPEGIYLSTQNKTFTVSTIKWMLQKGIIAPVIAHVTPEFPSAGASKGSTFLPADELQGVLHLYKAEQQKNFDAEFTYQGNGSYLGGAHAKHLVQDLTGKTYLFKPAYTIGGKKTSLLAYADYLAGKLVGLLRPEAALPVSLGSITVEGKKQFGSFQPFLSDVSMLPGVLDDKLKTQIQQEHVIDWLISNHDAHDKHFVVDAKGVLYGVDKTQAYKFFPDDQLSKTYHPNKQENPPFYNHYFSTGQHLNPSCIYDIVAAAQAISDTDFKTILLRYAVARYKNHQDIELFLHAACLRKKNLKTDLEKFYGTEIKAPVVHKSASEKETEKSKGNPVMVTALAEAGYTFYNFGAKSKQPKYKDSDGKTVYLIGEDGWEYYPMGSASMNPYGSSHGNGKAALLTALSQPFEKPEPEIPKVACAWTGEQAEKFKALPVHAFKLPDGYVTSGDPVKHTEMAGVFTSEEKGTIESYKGSGFSSINKFLYSGQEAHGGNYLGKSVSNINSALQKSKTNKDLVLWRGLQGEYSDLVRTLLLEGGKVIQPNCFQSCSTSRHFSHGWCGTTSYSPKVVLCIKVPKGTSAIAPNAVTTAYQSEKELILSHTVIFKVQGLYQFEGALYAEVNLVDSTVETEEPVSTTEEKPLIEVLDKKAWEVEKIWVEPTVTKTGVYKAGYFKTKKKAVKNVPNKV